jgi:hypothetical protein
MRSLTAGIIAAAVSLAGTATAAQPSPPPELDAPAPVKPSTGASGLPLCGPEKLTRMVVRNVSPGLPAAAPAAQPRTIYRQSALNLRTEETPDPARGQPVVVIAEPDIWIFNTANRKGQHQVDPGPELVVHAPVLPATADLPRALLTLEYGCELEFLRRQGAETPRQTIPWGAAKATVHQVQLGEHVVSVLLAERRQTPLMVAYAKANKPVFMIRYDEYRSDLPDRPELFTRPERVEFTEAPPRGAVPRPGQAPPPQTLF